MEQPNPLEATDARPPSVSVVVSVYNDPQCMGQCLESLLAQQLPLVDIIVVDDGSTDATPKVLERFRGHPLVRVITLPSNSGVPVSRNLGVRESHSEVVAFIDADAYAPLDWLSRLTAPFADPAVVCTGGPDRAPETDDPFALAVDYSLRSWIGSGRLRLQNPFAPYAPAGCNLAIRRTAFDAVGGFDERLNRRGEEKELIQRLRRSGKRIVCCPQAVVSHHRRATPLRFWRQNYLSGRARIDILRLAPDAFAWPHLAPAALVLAVLGAAACWFATELQALCLAPIATYLAFLVIDGVTAALSTRRWRVAAWVPVTTSMIHWGYGIGLLVGALRWIAGHPVGSGGDAKASSVSRSLE